MNKGLTIKKIFNGVLRRFLGTQIMKVHYLGTKTRSSSTDIDELVKPLEYNDFLLGDKEEFTEEKLKAVKEKFSDDSYKAFGIIDKGILIYSCWLSLKQLGLPVVLRNPILLNNDQSYLEDAYCSVSARGQGLHTKMITYRNSQSFILGKRESVITVLDGNIPALKANLKSGMKDLGVFYCGRILGRPFCTLTPKKKAKFDSKIQ